MQIDAIPEISLTPAHEAEIAALLARCFDTDFGGRSYFQQRHHLRLLARDPDLVGHVALTLRSVRLGAALIDVAGLAEVATDPGRRGEGIAVRLLAAAIDAAKASPAAFLLLFGMARLYGGAGFVAVRNPITWLDLAGARTGDLHRSPSRHLMVLSLHGQHWDETAHLDMMGHLF